MKRVPLSKIKPGIHFAVCDSAGSTDGPMQIQALHEPEDGSEPHQDLCVLLEVIRRAKRGDDESLAALAEVIEHDGLLHRVLWCQALGISAIKFSDYERWDRRVSGYQNYGTKERRDYSSHRRV